MRQPTVKQLAVFDFIKKHIIDNGFPPTVREVASGFGFASPLSAQSHINALAKKGLLKKSPQKQRSLEIAGVNPAEKNKIPLLGTVRAGAPVLAVENIEGYINIDKNLFKVEGGFALRVKGDSMIDAGILEGDIALISTEAEPKNGDIVVALIEDEATVKRFFLAKTIVRLVPENKEMTPMVFKAEEVKIIGRVKGILRRL
ncbi:MAG: transcriptional repressor LexA [Nitrospirae bacterium]|nr:transcriptional repressor LexA [Nitrospirota bacterium]